MSWAWRHDLICWWIGSTLGGRKIKATLAGEALEGSVARDCPQEDILLPLLWSLVVDELIRGLKENGCYTLGYADDIVTIIHRKFLTTTSELLQVALSMVQQWCDRIQLSMNPQKKVIPPSTQKIFKEAEGTNPLWIHTATDYQTQIPWTYSGQGTDTEETAEKFDG
jgi:hypothetical protein